MSPDDRIVFAGEITNGTRTRQFEVNSVGVEGWRIRERRDGAVVRQVIYDDWHRVELQVSGFVAEIARLKNEGWRRTS
jgi:hypothetical protein